jgi:hypothetical protein
MRSALSKSMEIRKSVAGQRSGKHAPITMKDEVFRGVRAKELSQKQTALWVQFWVLGRR